MGLAGAPSPAGASEASASGAEASASPAAAAVLTSAAGVRRAASTDWRLETSAAGSGLRFGASSPEVDSIGLVAGERLFACRLVPGMACGRSGEEGKREREVYGRRKEGRKEAAVVTGRGVGTWGGRWKWTEIAKWAGRAFFMDFKAGPALRVG